ncbi:MAG: hypothetical protein SFX72_10905 [Isosphaeraceae bacterium]|nr:hypothetical protein [Isosphaeraceae bacterium]
MAGPPEEVEPPESAGPILAIQILDHARPAVRLNRAEQHAGSVPVASSERFDEAAAVFHGRRIAREHSARALTQGL